MFRSGKPCILIIVAIIFSCQSVVAQLSSFVHIQSANSQPYYVLWNGNLFNSSASGYLVIPKVTAGEQTMVIGFARNQFPEYTFKYTMTDKPRGFSLKLAIDNSWSLFDMVKFTVIKGTVASVAEKAAVARPAVVYGGTETDLVSTGTGNTFLQASAVRAESGIQKIFDRTTSDGTDQVYIVNNDGMIDTVAVFIPFLVDARPKTTAVFRKRNLSPAGGAASFPPVSKEATDAAIMRQTPFTLSSK